MPQLRWAICDANGRLLAPIDQFQQDNLSIGINDIRNGTVVVSIEDEVVPLVQSMSTRLKAWLNGYIVLNAPVFLPSYNAASASETGTLTISATDNLRLVTAFTRSFAEQKGVDQSEIMARLVEAADATSAEKANGVLGHGILRGTLPASVARDRLYYDLTNIWEALLNMSQVIDGPDFELEPLDREDGSFAELNTYYPKQGSDRSATVKLEYGVGAHNASAFSWQPTGEQLCNRYIMAGATPEGSPTTPAYIAENLDSQRLYGIYTATEVDTEISEMATLRSRAQGVVATRAFPLNFFTVQPAVMEAGADDVRYGVPPRFGPPTDPEADFWLGDTVGIIARDGEMSTEVAGRAVAASLSTVDAAGNVAAAVAFTPPDQAAGVTGAEANLVLGPMNQTAGSEPTVETEDPPIVEEPLPIVEEEEPPEPAPSGGTKKTKKRKKRRIGIGPGRPASPRG